MRRIGVVLVGAVVVVGVTAVSGCSGDQRSAAGPSAEASSSAAANTATPGEVRQAPRQDPDSSVAQAVGWKVGDTGPGGGIVFYDAGSQQPWGRYLEAAPSGWYGSQQDPELEWCSPDQPGYGQALKTGTDVGSGRSNTALIIEACGSDSAAVAAAGYRGGGLDDWFLPSKDELDVLYGRRTWVPALAGDFFWSSSQYGGSETTAWFQSFGGGTHFHNLKFIVFGVRPVRAF